METSLNPCCDGRWSRTLKKLGLAAWDERLNPCCDGRWSRTLYYQFFNSLIFLS